jgi:predicted amidophosphoribosyltransferase
MLREHCGFRRGLVLEPPTEHRPHFADVLQLPVRLRVCCEQVLGTKRVCRPCRFRVSERGLRSPAVRGARLAFSSLFTEADRLPAAQQLLQRLKTNISMAVKGTTMAACAVRETARKTKAEAPTPRP